MLNFRWLVDAETEERYILTFHSKHHIPPPSSVLPGKAWEGKEHGSKTTSKIHENTAASAPPRYSN